MGYGEPKFKDVEFWWNYEELWSSRWVGGGQDVDGHEITGASGSMGHGTNFGVYRWATSSCRFRNTYGHSIDGQPMGLVSTDNLS